MKKTVFWALLLIALIAPRAWAQVSVTLNVESAGTLSSLIEPEKKYTITQLILTGEINSDDLKFIHEMAGKTQNNASTSGSLTTLNVSGAKTIQGGDYYYRVLINNVYHYYYSSTVNQDVYVTSENVSYYPHPSGYSLPYYVHYRNDLAKLPLESKITKLYLPNTATELTGEAFADCSQLTSVIIGNSAAMIRKNAFLRCTGLTSLTIPANVTLIEPEAFAYCSGMKNFYVNSNNTKYAGSAGVLYNKACTELHTYPWAKGAAFDVPAIVTVIGESAFLGDTQLTSVTLSQRLDAVNAKAFKDCSNLASITIPDHATTIGDEAFRGCSAATSLTIGNAVNTIGAWAFAGCNRIPSVTIPSSTTDIAANAFNGCSAMTQLILGDNLVTLGDNAFYGCSTLTEVVMPLSLVQTGEGIFRNCSSLKNVTISSNLMALKPYSFNGCSKLEEIHCHVVKPLSIVENVFTGVNYNTCHLYVPKGSYNAYWVAPVWGKFIWINEEYFEDPNADRIYIDNFEITPGGQMKVDVLLQNQSHTCVGFQCDIQLPTGLEFVYDESNYDYVVKAQRTAQYIVGSTMQSNGVLRVTGLSPNYRPLSGTSGAIFSFTVEAANNFEQGNININNAKLSTGSGDESDTYQAPATMCVVTAGSPTPTGDINGDGQVNTGDVSALYKALLNGSSDAKYDLNGDGSVNTGDVSALYKIILGN